MTNEKIGKAMFIGGTVGLLGLIAYACPLAGIVSTLCTMIFFGALIMGDT